MIEGLAILGSTNSRLCSQPGTTGAGWCYRTVMKITMERKLPLPAVAHGSPAFFNQSSSNWSWPICWKSFARLLL